MKSALSDVDHWVPFAEHPAGDKAAQKDMVIACGQSADDLAAHVSERLGQNRSASFGAFHINAFKRKGTRLKTAAEVGDHIGLAVIEDIDRKKGAFGQQA